MAHPVSGEVGAAFGKFFFGGAGPSHATLTGVFQGAGYASSDPYDQQAGTPNKQQRVLAVFRAAERHPSSSRRLVSDLLDALRVDGSLLPDSPRVDTTAVKTLRAALNHLGWDLTTDGRLQQQGDIDIATGGREALDEQLARLARNADDPAALLGGAKDLLESIAKFVLEEAGMLADRRVDFPRRCRWRSSAWACCPPQSTRRCQVLSGSERSTSLLARRRTRLTS